MLYSKVCTLFKTINILDLVAIDLDLRANENALDCYYKGGGGTLWSGGVRENHIHYESIYMPCTPYKSFNLIG